MNRPTHSRALSSVLTVALAFVGVALVPGSSSAVTSPTYAAACTDANFVYVDGAGGLDVNPGTAVSPKKSISAGLTAVSAGGTVCIATGTYTENLTISARITLQGAGSGSDPASATIIQSAASATPVVYIVNVPSHATHRVVLQGLRVAGATGTANTNASSGIWVQGTFDGHMTLDDVVASTNAGMGFVINTGGVVPTGDYLVTNSAFTGNGIGMKVGNLDQLTGLTIEGSTFSSNTAYGLFKDASETGFLKDVTISGSTFSANKSRGIYLDRGLMDLSLSGVTVDYGTLTVDDLPLAGGKRQSRALVINPSRGDGNFVIEDSTFRGIDGATTTSTDSGGNLLDFMALKLDRITAITGKSFTVRGNDVTDIPIGIQATGADAAQTVDLSGLDISNNKLGETGDATSRIALNFTARAGTTNGSPAVVSNDIFGGLSWNHSRALNAGSNKWGDSSSGPAAGQVSGTASGQVVTSPWISGYTVDPDKAADPGFWPLTTTLVTPVAASASPQTVAVADASAGSPSIDIPATGASSVLTVETQTAADLPVGATPFTTNGATLIDISLTDATGPFTVCVDGASPARLWHYESGAWVDITDRALAPTETVSPVAGKLCGMVATLSPFALAELKQTATVSISNIPPSGEAVVGGSFTPTFTYDGDGTTSATSDTTSVCTVTAGVVNFIAPGVCVLIPAATETAAYASATGSSQGFPVFAGEPASYEVTVTPTTPVAGSAVTVTAQLVNSSGAPVPTAGEVVTWSSTGGGGFASASSLTNATGLATVKFVTGPTIGTYTVSAGTDSLLGTSSAFTTVAGALAALVVTPVTATARVNENVAFTAEGRDRFGNSVGDKTTVSSFAIDKGSCSANVCRSTLAGARKVTALVGKVKGTATVTVTPGPAFQLLMVRQPAKTKVSVLMAPVSARVTDQYGNTVPTSAMVTVRLGSNPSGAVLGGTLRTAAVDGLVTFSNLTVSRIGKGYTLTFASPDFTTPELFGVTSGKFDIVS